MRAGTLLLASAAGLLVASPAAADGIMLGPAGAFWLGRDDGPAREAPAHRVHLRDFWIERHKVTNVELAEFLQARGLAGPEGEPRYDADARVHRAAARWVADTGYERHPAVEVSWFGARDHCAWKRRRRPTEAERERAARGASPFGVQGLLGSLREWTSAALRPSPDRADDGREPFTGAGHVVLRGASHDEPAEALAVTARHAYDRRGAAAGHHHVGFRCATSEDLGGR